MDTDLDFELVKPDDSISPFVESFWMLRNRSDSDKEIIVLPDGRIDLIFSQSATEPFHTTLSGLETQLDNAVLKARTLMFAVSFKLLATEYILHSPVAPILNYAEHLPAGFWDFGAADLEDFPLFCKKVSEKVRSLLPQETDGRKMALFNLLYESKGAVTVRQLSQSVYWSSRQIARYFHQQYGLSLKAYCNILRFRASLDHLAEGKLFPALNFADQSHFIKAVRKFSGVSPKELKRNQDDRFIQFSLIASK